MGQPRILIIDDDRQVRELCARALQMAGYDTLTAENAQIALALVEAAVPDALLTDLKMPYVNGLGFLYRLREAHPHLPVAIVTAVSNLDEATRREIHALGADLHHKPLRIVEIQDIARALIERRLPVSGVRGDVRG
jgi:two-component system nitrogen regulation response regulator GlnG